MVEDLPRVIRSVDMIHQEVGSLKERIAVVKEDVERVERDTADSMRLLMQFDEVGVWCAVGQGQSCFTLKFRKRPGQRSDGSDVRGASRS